MAWHDVVNSWMPVLDAAFLRPELATLRTLIEFGLPEQASVHPAPQNRFRALKLTPLEHVRCVILGQDPYFKPGQADGLAFSVPAGVTSPPSLDNIFTELERSGYPRPRNGCLEPWAAEGVLLLNSILTVDQSGPLSHQHRGWEQLTTFILEAVYRKAEPVVFMLWGNRAKEKRCAILEAAGRHFSKAAARKTVFKQDGLHLFLGSSHPSPRSAYRGFNGCNHFRLANDFLAMRGSAPIKWQLPVVP